MGQHALPCTEVVDSAHLRACLGVIEGFGSAVTFGTSACRPAEGELEEWSEAGVCDGCRRLASGVASPRGRIWWWNRTGYEHENGCDERVQACPIAPQHGVQECVVVARATPSGRLVVTPPTAGEMCAPIPRGREARTGVVVRCAESSRSPVRCSDWLVGAGLVPFVCILKASHSTRSTKGS